MAIVKKLFFKSHGLGGLVGSRAITPVWDMLES